MALMRSIVKTIHGYGGLLNVDRTVRGYAAAGASGIQLEDQEFPKKCGHTEFRRVIPADDAVAHSACVGFGLERVALALFKTHGFRLEDWPREVRDVLALG